MTDRRCACCPRLLRRHSATGLCWRCSEGSKCPVCGRRFAGKPPGGWCRECTRLWRACRQARRGDDGGKHLPHAQPDRIEARLAELSARAQAGLPLFEETTNG